MAYLSMFFTLGIGSENRFWLKTQPIAWVATHGRLPWIAEPIVFMGYPLDKTPKPFSYVVLPHDRAHRKLSVVA